LQRIAGIPLTEFEKHVNGRLRDNGELITADVLRLEVALRFKNRQAPPLPAGRCDVIYADPPYRYEFAHTHIKPVKEVYPTLSLRDICALPVQPACRQELDAIPMDTIEPLGQVPSDPGLLGFSFLHNLDMGQGSRQLFLLRLHFARDHRNRRKRFWRTVLRSQDCSRHLVCSIHSQNQALRKANRVLQDH